MALINDLPFVIQIDESWYFHKDPNIEEDEYLGDSFDDEPIVEYIRRRYPGLRFRVMKMYGGYTVEPECNKE